MNFYHQFHKKGLKSRNYCGCHLHIHQRSWIHAPCQTTKCLKKCNHSPTQYGCLMSSMENTSLEQCGSKNILDKEISVLEAAKTKLEDGGVLSDNAKQVVRKWQTPEKSFTHKQKKKYKIKPTERTSRQHSEDSPLPSRSHLDEIQNGILTVQDDSKRRSRIRDYQSVNRRLREKIKELSKQAEKNINGSAVAMEQPSALLKMKYDNLVTYVLKVEAENQHLKKAINPNDSESVTESVFDPFKLRIRHLEQKVLEQEGIIKEYQNMRNLEDSTHFDEELYIKLTTTRDIYETAIQGYKEQIKHLLIECSHLKILNEDLTHIRSTVESNPFDLDGNPEPACAQGVINKLKSLVNQVAFKADRDSVIASLHGIIANVEECTESLCPMALSKKGVEYNELNDKYVAAINTIEELSKKVTKSREVESKVEEEVQSVTSEKSEVEHKNDMLIKPPLSSPDVNASPKESESSTKDSDKSSELNQSLQEHITTLKENNRVLQEHVGYLEERLAVLMKEMKRKDEILDRISCQLDSKIRDCFNLRAENKDSVSLNKSCQVSELQADNDRLTANLAKVKGEKVHLEKSFRSHAYSLEEQVDQLSLKNAKFQKQLDTIINIYKETFAAADDITTCSWIHEFVDRNKD